MSQRLPLSTVPAPSSPASTSSVKDEKKINTAEMYAKLTGLTPEQVALKLQERKANKILKKSKELMSEEEQYAGAVKIAKALKEEYKGQITPEIAGELYRSFKQKNVSVKLQQLLVSHIITQETADNLSAFFETQPDKSTCKEYLDLISRQKTIYLMAVLEGGLFMYNCIAKALQEVGQPFIQTHIVTDSYRDSVQGGKKHVKLNASGCKETLTGADVVVVDDVCDTGGTQAKLIEYLETLKLASYRLVVGVNKQLKRAEGYEKIKPHYFIKDSEDKGWSAHGGMDFCKHFRSGAGVVTVDPKEFEPTPPPSPSYNSDNEDEEYFKPSLTFNSKQL